MGRSRHKRSNCDRNGSPTHDSNGSPTRDQRDNGGAQRARRLGLFLGPALFALLLGAPAWWSWDLGGLDGPARRAVAVTLWMAAWWVTEAIPINATALLPIVLFPLTGVLPASQVTLSYGNPLIFLFLSGFLLSVAIQKWGLHQRIALRIIMAVGFSPARIVLGFMAATGFLSLWISNTAAALMMVPIGLAVIRQVDAILCRPRAPGPGARATGEKAARPGAPAVKGAGLEGVRFGNALMLGIAYAASIGGLGTLIGSPPNAVFAGYVSAAFGETITFVDWMKFGLPLAALGLLLAWVYLTRVAHPLPAAHIPGAKTIIDQAYRQLGPMSTAEKRVAAVFALVSLLWIARGFLEAPLAALGLSGITDTTIGMAGALALFVLPNGNRRGGARQAGAAAGEGTQAALQKAAAAEDAGRGLIDWKDTVHIPWGVLLLFGGGLALASGIETSGAARWAAEQLAVLKGTPPLLVVAAVIVVVLILTEVTSNTATATIFMPVVAGVAAGLGVHPYLLMAAAATAASCAFMLPVATPPNAVVFGTGCVTLRDMIRAGLWLNVAMTVVMTALVHWWLPIAWGIRPGS